MRCLKVGGSGPESLRIRLAGGRYHGSRMYLIPGRGAGAPRPKPGFPQRIYDYKKYPEKLPDKKHSQFS